MEATQMMVDIDGDVLVFLELAQVGWPGKGLSSGSAWGSVCPLAVRGEGGGVGRKETHCQTQFPDWERPSPPPGLRMHSDLQEESWHGAWEHGAETSGSHRVGERTPASGVDMAAACLRSVKGHAGLPSKINCPPPYSHTN